MPRTWRRPNVVADSAVYERELGMWWGIGAGAVILYFILMVVLGLTCLRKGHWVMFILGIFFPLFWIIGAIIPPRNPQPA
jgi:hypothetical protein